ncbi:hypothetical protein [Olivibacter sp. XZL3]|uniref:hypothetical protein n=1 Tax=Olivibacter sp. XZL3 TaxID=1735116 RepID=UPI00106531F4|nr:hypothetical protein [Olivibacter sp. XZL3]
MKSALLFVLIGALFSFTGLCSCSSDKDETKTTDRPYFDLVSYFEQQARHLQEVNPVIVKTVGKNEQREQKKLQLSDWQRELDLFASSDINKPDWLQRYSVDSTNDILTYRTKDPELRTKEIKIHKDQKGRIKRIYILNGEKNWLYESLEKLDYYPDSLYRIEKEQAIRIIGRNSYLITGKIAS